MSKIVITESEAREKWDERKAYYLTVGYDEETAEAYAASDIQDIYTWDS